MSSSGISFGGLSSGLDSKAIIAQLVAIERRPIDKMTERKTLLGRQKALLADFETKLKALKTAADDLRSTSRFLQFKTAVDETGFFTATATGSASEGSYTIAVTALAKARQSATTGAADKDTTTFGTGTLNIAVNGTTKNITIDSGNNTLQGIADAINGSDAGVNATVVNTGSGTTPYRLVVTSRETGVAKAFTISTGDAGLAPLVNELNAAGSNQVVAAADAQFTVNGLQLTRSSNTVTDAIAGVTLNLNGVHPAATNPDSSLTVTTDATAVSDKVKKLVDAYNDVVNFVKTHSTVDSKGKSSSPLFGDSTLRSIRSTLREVAGSAVDTGSTAYQMLSQVGVTSDRDGLLTFNADKFKTALDTDETAVQNLFTKTGIGGTGLAQALYGKTDAITNLADGIFATRRKGIESKTADIDRQVRQSEQRLRDFEQRLTFKYAAMETAVGRLKAMGNSIGIRF